MNRLRLTSRSLSGITLALLAACTTTSKQPAALQPVAQANTLQGGFTMPYLRHAESADQTLADFSRLESVLADIKNDNDFAAAGFLSSQSQSAMGETVRNEWLKSLGKRGDAAAFRQQYAQLDHAARQQEVRCYAHIFGLENDSAFVGNLLETTGKLPAGCNTLLQAGAANGVLDIRRAWRRVRGLISNGHITDADNLAAALGSPLNSINGFGYQENLLRNVITPGAQKKPDNAAALLQQLSGSLNRDQTGFAWGVLGLAQAKNLNMHAALDYYRRAERSQLNDEQFEWYARAALRQQRWHELADIIRSMPSSLQSTPTWQYWLARSYAAQGKKSQAHALFEQAAKSGRNFYAVLSTEELGQRIHTRNNVDNANPQDVAHLSRDGALRRALTLFHTSRRNGDWKMRRQAQNEWRYATRGMNETTLLAAAQLAFEHEFYEMAVNSAERTDHLLNFNLRYITPFRDLVTHYSHEHNVDPAWVYGLIRQESRFVMGAQSSAGAQGLMQVMPATARLIAGKIGMNGNELYTMDGNIRMGTWYMADARRSLQNNEVLATAGYNAGPGRARRWQADISLEGAVYAETIPFNETRDYVKKVMTNAVYYASLMKQHNVSLKQKMGTVPAR